MPGFTVFAQFRGKESSDWDKKYVSELGKISSLTYEKLADHDRIPLKKMGSLAVMGGRFLVVLPL